MPPNVDHIEYPVELCAKPLALIGFTGLDTLNNAIHKTVWDTFSSNRRAERAAVTFKLLSSFYEFPIIKPKRNSYEWYIPKGILKRNWMNKHLNVIPAVIVIFYDLDWNDSHWNEKMIECSSRVQSMRAAVEGRNTRITVVLIQQTLPLPANEDVLAAERAAALCANCELNTKSLFILPLGDHLQGYTVRLETAFFDLAQNYYHYEARNVKSHRDHLNKTTHQYLFVRHQFKMGFLNELKQDNHTAYKHYTHAYNNLLELRIVDTNIFEIKTIAGYINYKLCRLMFNLNLPRDAISQFKAHIDRFKSRIGFRELAFEHYAWLAKQYSMFGDIFDEAVKLGLPAVQTQHPGVYYQLAAQNAVLRKQSCEEVCKDICEYPKPDPLNEIETLEFYGQRPWRPGKLSVEPPDPHKEQSGIEALQYLEKQVNHSNLIISLYGLAISQFKTYRCHRMRRRLVIQMADEYYLSKDYGKALTLLTHMLWDYRSEKWWLLISNILQKALNCAYLSANIQDYVILSLEILGEHITIPQEDKIRVFNNLCNILKKLIPQAEKDISIGIEEMTCANNLWNSMITCEPLFLSVEMSNIMSCIDCKARFTQSNYEADQKVSIQVFLKSTWFNTINFSYLSVIINTANYSSEYDVKKYDSNPDLSFEKNQIKKYIFEFSSDIQDIGQEIQIASVLLHLGEKEKKERYVILKFPGTSNSNNRNYSEFHITTTTTSSNNEIINFDNIKPLSSTQIMPRLSKLKIFIDHKPPSLLEEWYLINIQVRNEEILPINNIQVKIDLEIDEVESELATEFNSTSNGIAEQLPLILKLSNLHVNETTSTYFYMRSHKTGDRNVSVKLSYLFEADKSISSVKEQVINIPVCKAFDVGIKFFSNRFEEISKLYIDEVFLIMPQLKCTSHWPIFIQNTMIEFNSNQIEVGNHKSQLNKITLNYDETGAEIITAKVIATSDKPIAIGYYNICWHRIGCTVYNNTRIALKGLHVDQVPLGIVSVIPEHGFLRTPMPITFQLHNRSAHLIQLDMVIDASEAFMFAGYKQIQITILPKSIRKIYYNLYPLIPGSVALPKLKFTISDKNTEILTSLQQLQLTELLDRCLPSHIYIMPQVKGKPLLRIPEITSTTEAY